MTVDVSKLPKWARDRIRVLEMRVQEAEAREAIGPEDSDTFANPHAERMEGAAPRPLGRGETVRFYVDKQDDRYFDVRLERDGLRVSGAWMLAVCPEASNTVRVVERDG